MRFFTKPSRFSLLALLCALALAASPAHADFWVGNNNAETLQYINSNTGGITQTIDFNVYGTGNHAPGGIALDANNNLWVADTNFNNLAEYLYNSNTGQWNSGSSGQPSSVISLPSGAINPEGIAIYDGSVYVVDKGTGSNESVQQYNIGTKSWSTAIPTSTFPSNGYPEGIAINSSGNLFVTEGSYIYEFTNRSNSWSLTSTLNGASYAYGLAFDSQGNLFAASSNLGHILEYANTNGSYSTSSTIVVSSADSPVGLAFDPTTGYLLDAENGGSYSQKVVAYSLLGSPSTGTYKTDYSPTGGNGNPQPYWLAGFQPQVATVPAPSGLVLFALGFGCLGLMYRWKQRNNSLHPFVPA
jgi:hypothetical protein